MIAGEQLESNVWYEVVYNINVDNKENTNADVVKEIKTTTKPQEGVKNPAQKRAQKLKDNAQKSKEENASNARLREQKDYFDNTLAVSGTVSPLER